MLVQTLIVGSRAFRATELAAAMLGAPLSFVNARSKLARGMERLPMEVNPATAHMSIFILSRLKGVLGLVVLVLYRDLSAKEDS